MTAADLRHTFATLAVQSGVDVKTLASMLGHYSAGFTLDTYTHVTGKMQLGAADKIGGFMDYTVCTGHLRMKRQVTRDSVDCPSLLYKT